MRWSQHFEQLRCQQRHLDRKRQISHQQNTALNSSVPFHILRFDYLSEKRGHDLRDHEDHSQVSPRSKNHSYSHPQYFTISFSLTLIVFVLLNVLFQYRSAVRCNELDAFKNGRYNPVNGEKRRSFFVPPIPSRSERAWTSPDGSERL